MDRAMVFGKYCLLERISVGGMAEVFRAKPLPAYQSDKMLALKRILPHLAEDDEFITMFVDEAKLTVQLEHPNIVETYELGNFQSSYYILMEYIAGEDVLELQKRLRQNRRIMSVAQACFIAARVARGLHYAHTACDDEGRPFNIIHRDVSPQNIRLTWDGRVKLIDFGIAKAAVQRTKTQVGVLKGKFGYMSPEQVRGEQIDHRSDVFALGTTLWEMLTNRRLFNGENEYETLQMVKHPDIPPPSEKNSRVPQEVDDIVMRALHEDRDERFQSGMELSEALDGFVDSLPTPYTGRHLSEWMRDTFDREFAEERRKRELYRQVKSADDVRWFNREHADEPVESEEEVGESVVAGEEELEEPEEDQIWDPDFAPDEEEEVDPEAFAADHTVVAAGGFDPAKFEDEEDEFIALADDDIIAIEDDEIGASDAPPPSSRGEPSGDGPGGAVERAETVASGGPAGDSEEMRARASGSDKETHRPGEAMEARPDEREDGATAVRIAFAVAAVVAVVALGSTVVYLAISSSGEVAGPAEASLVVEVEPNPSVEGTVLVDGKPRGKRAPATIPGLDPGTHTVEARFPGYEPTKRKVELGHGALQTVTFELDSKGSASGEVRLSIPEVTGEIRVYVDGRRRSWSRDAPALSIDPGRHLIEAVAPEVRPWSRVVEVEQGRAMTEVIDWRSRRPSLRIEAEEKASVEFDGDSVGETPVRVDDLSPSDVHSVELEALEGYDRWDSHLGYPRLGQRVLRVSFDDPPESYDERDFGSLTVSAGEDWWNVLVDGVPTGQITPIESDEAIPVAEGEHRVTLRRGSQVHEFPLEFDGGETTSVSEELSFEWSDTGM